MSDKEEVQKVISTKEKRTNPGNNMISKVNEIFLTIKRTHPKSFQPD